MAEADLVMVEDCLAMAEGRFVMAAPQPDDPGSLVLSCP